jgi:hypothetical protein
LTSEGAQPKASPLVVLDALDRGDRARWLDLWGRWPEREPTAHPSYLAAIAAPDERPMCASMDFGDGGVIYPFLLRPIYAEAIQSSRGLWDITGPLTGYTGAFHWNLRTLRPWAFWYEFQGWATSHGVVSSFVRLSLFDDQILPFDGRTRVVQPNVIRDLQLPDDTLWTDFEHKVRKNVKRALADGLVVAHDPGCEDLEAFMEIYASTMRRRAAPVSLLFDLGFFQALAAELAGSLQLFFARAGSSNVAAELVLTSAHHGYSFLGGTLASSFAARPNDLLKYEIIRSLRDQGFTHYVLGGGPRPGDGIFRYKRSFAPNGVVDFKVGERVHDEATYEELVQRHSVAVKSHGSQVTPDSDYFPAYRSATGQMGSI